MYGRLARRPARGIPVPKRVGGVGISLATSSLNGMEAGMKRDRGQIPYLETKARQLARTGKYPHWRSIQAALLSEGFSEAQKLFANRWTQAEVDRICEMPPVTGGAPLNFRLR
jgi:hypothetical protein